MLRTASWLARVATFVLVGLDVFLRGRPEQWALISAAVAYALCGVLMALWVLLEQRPHAAWAVPLVLGLITVVSGAACVLDGSTSLGALAVVATMDAGTEPRLLSGWAVFTAGILAVTTGALVGDAGPEKAIGVMLLLAVGLLVGLNRRAYRVWAEQNATLLTQAEELRAEQQRSAVLDERARIAREIHDVLAHSLGALGIQVQTARALLADRPDPARADHALSVAQQLAAEGLAETRRAVHALRADSRPLEAELAALATAHEQRHHTPVALRVDGTPVPLSPEQTLALIRTAQESLTNAAKHAPRQPPTLTLTYEDADVVLRVANPLGAGAASGFATVDGGYGLTGMRERLLLLGGTLTSGPVRDAGWAVIARVPR
ncbi:sensor histidine kinase [Streptomyces sp. NPDC056161]|uniref:sensor histidine kinase n=1 Tax=Streptomyces sp. NPDC056161 TaxID=3345732 RepID=UPI0035DF212D